MNLRNKHHLAHPRGLIRTTREGRQLDEHGLMVAKVDAYQHKMYHGPNPGIRNRPHSLVLGVMLEQLEEIKPEEPTPLHVVQHLAYEVGRLSLLDDRLAVQRSAQQVEELLLGQVTFLTEGKASYEG